MRAALFLWFAAASALYAQIPLAGRVVDENGAGVAGARLVFSAHSDGKTAATASDSSGHFRVDLAPGEYSLHAERLGFFALERANVAIAADTNQLTVTLNHVREVVESVDVSALPTAVDPTETTEEKQLNSLEILEVPYSAPSDFRSSLPLFQGVIQDRLNRIHFNGGSADQASFLLDGFNIADPATGTFDARLSIDAVRSLDLETSRYSAGKGRGSTASLDVKSGMGDDHFSVSGTNFFPGVTAQRGIYVNKWTPRVTFSGPLVKGRAWFYNGLETFYNVDTVRELPPGQDRQSGLSLSNLSRFQVNLTPSQILTGSFLVNYRDENHTGLSFLDPVETTVNRRRNFYMGALKHQAYFHRGVLLEFGFAATRGIDRDNPMGTQLFQISPSGRRGNYFVDLDRHTSREQWFSQLLLPTLHARGAHLLSFGVDFQNTSFNQLTVRHPYVVLRVDGTAARQVSFTGDGRLAATNLESGVHAQDRWALRDDLQLELGVRADRDGIVGRTGISPRAAVAFAPHWLDDTKLSAGYGIYRDALTLGLVTQDQDQVSLSTFFPSAGGPPPMAPARTSFRADLKGLRVPSSRILSLSADRKLLAGFYGRAGYLRRVGRDGLVYVLDTPFTRGQDVIYSLRNARNDRYDAIEISVRRTFANNFEWSAGYTWSKARTDAVVDYSLEDPIFAPQGPGRLEWDSPHRFLSWGWAPLPALRLPRLFRRLLHDTNVSYLFETRTGFPFSVVNEDGFLIGRPNTYRLPSYFGLNLHFEKRFRLLRTTWAWRFGLNNITNHQNPNVVNNNIDAPGFLSYERGQPRAFSVRLRFLGRK